MKQWTILVFMAADNDLDRFAVRDLHEMEFIGSTSNVDLVVQVDRYGDGEKGVALRGRIEKDPSWQRFEVRFVSPLTEIGETNTGDPDVLQAFIEWGVLNFPAEQFALVIWNHGSGWKPEFIYKKAEEVAGQRMATAMRNVDFASRYHDRLQRVLFRKNAEAIVAEFIQTSVPKAAHPVGLGALFAPYAAGEKSPIDIDDELEKLIDRAIALDETSNRDALDCVELKGALQRAMASVSSTQGRPFKLDILGFDACLMAGLEVAFQVRDVTSYVVGSEEIEPAIGWRYDLILEALTAANGNLSPQDLSRRIVAAYIQGMQDYKIRLVTQSCVDIAEIDHLARALSDLGELLSDMISTEYATIAKSEKQATRFYDTDFLDLVDFVNLLRLTKSDSRLDNLIDVFERACVASEYLFPRERQAPTGLSVYFPTKPKYDDAYATLDLSVRVPAWPAAIRSYHFLDEGRPSIEFFVPDCNDPADAELQYQSVARFFNERNFAVSQDRIFEIRYRHKELEFVAQVGRKSSVDNEIVMAIYALKSGSFLICTRGRGWDLEHLPIITGSGGDDMVLKVIPFHLSGSSA